MLPFSISSAFCSFLNMTALTVYVFSYLSFSLCQLTLWSNTQLHTLLSRLNYELRMALSSLYCSTRKVNRIYFMFKIVFAVYLLYNVVLVFAVQQSESAILSLVWLFAIPGTVAHQVPCPWNCPGKTPATSCLEYWSACYFLLHGIFLPQGSNLYLLHLLHWHADFLPLEASRKPQVSYTYTRIGGIPGGSVVKNPPARQETRVQSLGWEDPLEKEMATHSSILCWAILWT